MDIQKARNEELQEIMSFYNMICEKLGKKDFLPEGAKGVFPFLNMVVSTIKNRELYIGKENGIIMAAYIMNNDVDPIYGTVKWQLHVPKEKASVLHALRVHLSFGGKGYAHSLWNIR